MNNLEDTHILVSHLLDYVESVRCDDYELEINFQNEDLVIVSGKELQAIINDGWVLDSVRSFADAGMSLLFTRKEMIE